MPKKYQIVACDESPSYRYRLDVETLSAGTDTLVVIQMNPSSADATRSDPTIGKVSNWAAEHGFGKIVFLNLWAYRATKPADLLMLTEEDMIGARNDQVIRSAMSGDATIVCAWGKILDDILPRYRRRIVFLKTVLGEKAVHAVGQPVAGEFPRHGRMWNGENRSLRRHILCAD